MYDLLKTKLLTQPVLHADETYYRVLESETAKTYYWVFLFGRHDKHGITPYHHNPHRSGQVALDFLGASCIATCGRLTSDYLKLP